ncbi:MAG: thiol-disulfide isomerase/thioredoxin [Kiritimatiellia bacterium]|jgi:thiol-disulfide isomerase/thioredoxin
MRWSLGVLVVFGACVPKLTSPGPPDLADWDCPDNQWECTKPPAEIADDGITYGFFEGQTLPDGVLVDQNGDELKIWQLYGDVVLLDISTMWCVPCKKLACYAEDTGNVYAPEGFTYITLLPQNVHGQTPSVEDLNVWASNYSLTSPVVSDEDGNYSFDAVPTGSYPTYVLTNSELVVQQRLESPSDPEIRIAIEQVLGIEHKDIEPVTVCGAEE